MDEIQSFSLLLYFDQILLHIFSKIVFFSLESIFFLHLKTWGEMVGFSCYDKKANMI